MTREDMVDRAIESYVEENMAFRLTDILHNYKDHSYEYLEKYLWDFHVVFQKALKEQKNGTKGVIGYAGISSNVFSVYFQEEWKHYLEYMDKHVIRVQKQEYLKFRCKLIHKYQNISKAVIKMYLPYILNLKSYAMLDKSEEFHFVFGEYMGAIEKINEEDET